MQAGRHMAAMELRLPVSRRFLCLGRITSCWVPLRGDAFKAAALGAAGATSGDRLHTLPQALHFFSLSLLSGSLPPFFLVSELIFHRLAVDSARLRAFTDFRGRVAAIWQRLTGGAQLLSPPPPNSGFYFDFPNRRHTIKERSCFQASVSSSEFHFPALFPLEKRERVCSDKHSRHPRRGFPQARPRFFEAAKGEKPKTDSDKGLGPDETS